MFDSLLFKKQSIIALIASLLPIGAFSFTLFIKNKGDTYPFATAGNVAYAASYDTSMTREPQYSLQKTKTFDYLNLGNTHSFYRGNTVKVGVIDSGINYDHEDFMVNGQTKVKNDSKYYNYQSAKWVYYRAGQHGYSYIDDTLGHGTNVAATIASAVNGVGGTGLAPNVELFVYKVTNAKNEYEFGAIQNALIDAEKLGIDVINMSFQSYERDVAYGNNTMAASSGCSNILSSYLTRAHNAGITLVGAAGNFNTNEPSYPGSNNYVINVGSLSSDGTTKAPFSNYGANIDLVAPGYVHVASISSNSAYIDTSGTSFSAPLVTAAIALYIQKHPNATPSQIEQALYDSCDAIPNGSGWAGHGKLNVYNFLDIAEEVNIPVAGVSLNTNSLSMHVEDGAQLNTLITPSNATNQAVTYTSSNEDAVWVDENGFVLAVQPGTSVITVTTEDGGFTDKCSVTVI